MNCTQVQELFSEKVDGLLEASLAELVDIHLADCLDCEMAWAEYSDALSLLTPPTQIQPSRQFTETVLGRIDREIEAPSPRGRVTRLPFIAGALVGMAAAVLIGFLGVFLMFSDAEYRTAEATVTPEYFHNQLSDNISKTNALIRQVAHVSESDPVEAVEAIRYEFAASSLPEFTRDLRVKYDAVADKLSEAEQRQVRTYLETMDSTLGKMQIVITDQSAPHVKLSQLKQLVNENQVMDSVVVVAVTMADSQTQKTMTINVSADDVNNDLVLFKAGRADFYHGRYAEAMHHFNTLLKNNPNSNFRMDAIYWLGNCSEKLGDRELAMKYYRQLVSTRWLDRKVNW
jgi:TolA-binding protein